MPFKQKALSLLLFLFFAQALAVAQTAGELAISYMIEAEGKLVARKYQQAIKLYNEVIELQPDNYTAIRYAGLCYYLQKDFTNAIKYYEKVLDKNPSFSRALYYELGESYYKLGNYGQSLEYFDAFEDLQKQPDYTFRLRGEREKQQEKKLLKKLPASKRAARISMDSTNLVNISAIINLGESVNSPTDEYFPFLSNDRNIIYYTKKKEGKQKDDENLFYSKRKDAIWQKAKQISNFNTDEVEGMCTIVRDGKKMYFTACSREGVYGPCDIWQADVDGVEISNISNLEGFANSNRWESQACISCDGTLLYFASNREGGMGGTDIWYCTRLPNGKWSPPANMGPKINTTGDEEAPFISNDGKSLYFSSTGHLGLGDQDIFVSWKNRWGHWTEPMNLGPPVNSPFRELGLFLTADGQTGLFASDRPGGQGGMDIYEFELSERLTSDPITYVEVYVIDSILGIPIQTEVDMGQKGKIQTDENGRFFLCINADETLNLKIDHSGFHPYKSIIPIPIWDNKTFYTIEALLQSKFSFLPAPIDSVMKDTSILRKQKPMEQEFSHTVFFGFDKSSLEVEEISRLDDFIKPLHDKNIQRVEIIGFSDDIGANSYNLKLSEDRAKQIALFLLENQIIVDQIYLEGKGEINNDKPKSRNRKVEVKIVILE